MAVMLVQGIDSDRGTPVASSSRLVEEDVVEIRVVVDTPSERVGREMGTAIQEGPITS